MRASWAHLLCCALFVLAAGLVYPCARLPPGERASAYIALHLLLSALMLAAWVTARGQTEARWTGLAGVAARLLLVGAPAFTSNDAQRYLWDGRVLLAGHDPYLMPPGATELAPLQAAWPMQVDQLSYPMLYPPGALTLFAATAALGPVLAPWGWKLLVTFASVATVLLFSSLARGCGKSKHLTLVALCPLLVLESGVGAHLDTFVALAVVCSLWLSRRQAPGWSGAVLGLGALLKVLPIFMLLPLAASASKKARRGLVLGAALAVASGYAAALLGGLVPLGSARVFFERWRFGSPLFPQLEALAGGSALWLAAGLLAAGLGLVTVHSYRSRRPAAAQSLALPLGLSPVVFPWYLVPLVPSMALAPSAFFLSWITLAPLTYEVIDGFDLSGVWAPRSWPLWTLAAALAASTLPALVRISWRGSPVGSSGWSLLGRLTSAVGAGYEVLPACQSGETIEDERG